MHASITEEEECGGSLPQQDRAARTLSGKTKLLQVDVYGQQRTIGWLSSDRHTDARTLVQKLVREQTGMAVGENV